MRTIKKFISKRTAKLRYKFVFKIIKIITPDLYDFTNVVGYIGQNGNRESVSNIPRPSIIEMNDFFSNKYVVGAEIGVYKGDNSNSILNILNIEKLSLIDPWAKIIGKFPLGKYPLKVYRSVLKRFKDNPSVNIIRTTSKKGSELFENESLDFVYIDADHSYQNVYDDIDLWTPKVRLNGIVAGHDIFNIPAVLHAVKDWCEINKTIFFVKLPDWYFFKS
jgi:hypothetical protein